MTMPLPSLFLFAFALSLICSLFITGGNLRDSFALMRACLVHWLRAFRRGPCPGGRTRSP